MAQITSVGVVRGPNEKITGTKNPARGRVFDFPASGGRICTVPTVPQLVRLK